MTERKGVSWYQRLNSGIPMPDKTKKRIAVRYGHSVGKEKKRRKKRPKGSKEPENNVLR
jgi:hypothetical protein